MKIRPVLITEWLLAITWIPRTLNNISAPMGGPYGKGHLGDLPALEVDNNGNASLPLLAPRLHLVKLKNHALIIHAGSDNYADIPTKLGGGTRIACGVIK
jgi:Cu/Zn superoxide dismutase